MYLQVWGWWLKNVDEKSVAFAQAVDF
jgi:hypothetical protein